VPPAIKIIEHAKKHKAEVLTFDPHIPEKSTEKSLEQILKKSKALILVTDHNEFKSIEPETFKKYGIKVIVDGKNCLDKNAIKKLGIIYRGIGR
jgi:UDP-N-acetyl-D-mannosaminuronate dehydrogenase